ncbi:MAG: hypothetical protein ACLFQA_11465 [Bacteroidales bacterium]
MKTGIGILLFAILMIGSALQAQDCTMYFPENIGSEREMRHYDQRDRLSAITRHEILDKVTNGNNTKVKVRATSYDEDETEIYSSDLELYCEDGVFRFDLKDYLDPATLATYEEMGIEFTADNLIYPASLNAGDQLPDGEIKMVVKSGAATILTMTVNISNRKVEEMEDITTDAGTFSCYKISYDINSKAGFINTSSSAVEWIADGVGMVRNETFNRRGKLTGYTVLTNFKN